ncbi:MAG TPA: BMP family protein [Anaerolineae bacterium]|nr:BMP family protein [Anaerolineae bacterium]
MSKRLFWLLVALVSVALMLAACGGQAPTVDEAAKQAEEAAQGAAEQVEQAAEEAQEAAGEAAEAVEEATEAVQEEAAAAVEEAQEAVEGATEEAQEAVEGAVEETQEAVEEAMSGSLDIEPVRIAIVMPSTVTDLAWSQSMYDALVEIQERAGGEDVVEIAYTENMFNVTDAAAALRDYAADGYDIVIAHGTQYGTSMFEIAPDFPETSFAWGTATDTGAEQGLENVFAYEALAQEGGFVNGVLAANMTESNVIGVVGPVEAGDAKLYIDGFVEGVASVDPDITVNVSYTGSFGDTALAAEAANTHIQAGADILTGSAQQVVGAIGVAQEAGVPWMGTQSDQSPLAPEIVAATQLYDWTDTVIDMIQKHQAGEVGGTAYALSLANGGLKMVYNEDLASPEAITAANAAAAEFGAAPAEEGAVEESEESGEAMATEEATAEEMAVEIEPVRIALVMPSTTTDISWSQSLYDSLVQLQEAAGEDVVEIAYTENMFNVTDAAAAIRDYADDGYDLVIAHGAQYGSSLFEIAPDFPDTTFAWGTTTDTGASEGITNIFAYEPRADQGGYVLGVLAANLTESGVIGLVGPVDAGDAKLHVDGFVAGVHATDPDIQVNVSFTGSFGDTALAAEAANTHVAAGADVLTGSSQQVVGAIGVAKDDNVPWIGFQADQSSVAPEVVVATILYDWRNTLVEMIQKHQAGEMGGEVLQLTLANGGQVPVYNPDLLPAEAIEAAEAAKQGIIDGSIEIVAEPR